MADDDFPPRLPAVSELTLPPGKHAELTARASGQVRGATTVSARLAAFTLADGDRACRVLLKDRDGFFSAEAIRRIMAALAQAPDAWAHVEGFPEVEQGASCVILHCSRLVLRAVDGGVSTFEPDSSEATARASATAGGEATGDDPSRSKKSGTRARAKTDTRHQHFAAWLCEVYGEGFLRSGRGVLDVAGGAGGLAFELSMRREIPCIVVDPRPVRCNAKQRRALRSQLQRAPALLAASAEPELAPSPASSDAPSGAAHDAAAAAAATPPVATAAGAPPQPAAHDAAAAATATPPVATAAGAPPQPTELSVAAAQLGARPRVLPLQVLSLFDDAFARAHPPLLHESSMLVGMHPDQATEALIDLAVASRKPFALLPCCVFPTLFSARRLADGREVGSYEELCEYLVAKAVALYARLPRLEHATGGAAVLCGKCAERGEVLPTEPLGPRAGDAAAADAQPCDGVAGGFVVSSVRLHSFEGRNLVIFSVPVGHDPRSPQWRY